MHIKITRAQDDQHVRDAQSVRQCFISRSRSFFSLHCLPTPIHSPSPRYKAAPPSVAAMCRMIRIGLTPPSTSQVGTLPQVTRLRTTSRGYKKVQEVAPAPEEEEDEEEEDCHSNTLKSPFQFSNRHF